MGEQPFVGIGHNPDGADLPLGLGMNLMQHPAAMDTFGRMSEPQKEQLIAYLKSAHTGEEAESRMMRAIQALSDGQVSF